MNRYLKLAFVVQLVVLAALVIVLGLRWKAMRDEPVTPTPPIGTSFEAPDEAQRSTDPASPMPSTGSSPAPEHPPSVPPPEIDEKPAPATEAEPMVLRASTDAAVPDVPEPEPVLPDPVELKNPDPTVESRSTDPLDHVAPAPTGEPEQEAGRSERVSRRSRPKSFTGTPARPHRYFRGLEVSLRRAAGATSTVVQWSGRKPPVALVLQHVELPEGQRFGGLSSWSLQPFEGLERHTAVDRGADQPALSVYLVGAASAHGSPEQSLSASAPDGGARPEAHAAASDGGALPAAPSQPPPSSLYVDGACA